ncbi:PAS domain S-box protein [Thauera chlorobenzoica]|uniref:histidine kinase n=1 Tax=Thauera chlorobenzoica TaxID=96773 RepID=A0A1H5YEV0_9RHOO|nr:PAS domain S-box protein [Thauera chlorobenzoica]APR05938.1 Histidine kinase [Thauera chlorobenzoica]SEG22170.1 PAS/PAC sensor signal transduction histidine kinase [Thauera chlorobenzoica]
MPESHAASFSSQRWYWTAPYAAVVLFALAMLSLVWLLQQRELELERDALARDMQWAEQTMRRQMLGTEEFLGQLARDLSSEMLDHDGFQLRANQHIANHAELANIVWVGGDGIVRWSAPFDTTDRLPGEVLSSEQARVLQRVRGSLRVEYGAAHRSPRGGAVLEVYVPVVRSGEFRGAIVGVYSIERMARYLVPAWFADKYRLALHDVEGELLATSALLPALDERLSFDLALDPPGNGLGLRATAFRSGSGVSQLLPMVLILGLSVLVLWSLWTLRSHVQRRVQVEKERDRLFNLSLDMLCVVGLDGRFCRCNPAFARILGHDPEALPGRSLIDFVHADDVGPTLDQLRRLAAGEPVKFENRCRCADDSYKWLVWSINPVPEERLVYAVAHDITGRKATEEALRAESAFRKAMEDSVVTGLRAIDLSGRIIYANSAFCRMIGFDEDELIGTGPPFPYWPEESRAVCERNLALTLSGQAPAAGFEMRIRRKNGERFDARFYLSPLIDSSARQTGWMASITDITEPKRVRAALEAAHERFEAVLDGLDAAVFVADARTDEILFANRAFKRIHGFDAVGRTVNGVAVPQPERGDYRVDPRSLGTSELPRELFDGELQHPLSGRWYHVREQATRWVDGRLVRMGIATDITDRKQTAEVARQQEDRLQRTARLITMGEMASTLAHELNQPLAAIANYCAGCVTRMQGGQWRPEDVLAAMQKASFQAERAGKIIRRVREFVKKSEPRRSAVRLAEILDDALGFAEIDARRVGIRIVAEVEPRLPDVFADRIMIEQVLLNLIRNGLDAMADALPERRVLVLRVRSFGPDAVEVAVIDRGHGISEEGRRRLFTPFYTTKAEGMGMGLNICRSIVEFHDGRLLVDANPEGGTIFTFTLPTETASERIARSA